jgi:hypothetical protein
VTFRLPDALAVRVAYDPAASGRLDHRRLARCEGPRHLLWPSLSQPGRLRRGVSDGWSSQPAGADQADVLTADDLIAVKFLSMTCPPPAQRALLL